MGLDSGYVRASMWGGHGEPEVPVPLGARGGLQYLSHAHAGKGKDQALHEKFTSFALKVWFFQQQNKIPESRWGHPAAEQSGLQQYG